MSVRLNSERNGPVSSVHRVHGAPAPSADPGDNAGAVGHGNVGDDRM